MAAPVIIALFIVFACFLETGTAAVDSKSIKYTYLGDGTGPSKWGSLDPKYSLCSNGKKQSPIDICTSKAVHNPKLKPLITKYQVSNATLTDNLANIGLNFGPNSGVLISDGKEYKLVQMHWHTPSEHTLDGVQYDAELHLVHLADDGTYAVTGIFYCLGQPDPIVSLIQKELHILANPARGYAYKSGVPLQKFSLNQIEKMNKKYYKYYGSFTTPPCTESVTWYLLGKKTMSKQQIEDLKVPLGPAWKSNARPVQPLYSRQIELYLNAMKTPQP